MSVALTDDVLIMAFDSEGRDFSSSTRHSKPSRLLSFKALTSTFNRINPFGPDSPSAGPSQSRALGHLGSPLTSPFDRVLYMMPLGRSKNEDRAPPAQAALRAELVESIQVLFMCGICFEEMPDDSIARPDPCGHTFCRECLRGHVTTCLEEHRFPILCPTCTAGKGKGKAAAGGTCREQWSTYPWLSHTFFLEISQSLALDLGLNEEQYGIWVEMEMASFSVLLHCRKYVYSVRPLLW
jgi:Ring finger domain